MGYATEGHTQARSAPHGKPISRAPRINDEANAHGPMFEYYIALQVMRCLALTLSFLRQLGCTGAQTLSKNQLCDHDPQKLQGSG